MLQWTFSSTAGGCSQIFNSNWICENPMSICEKEMAHKFNAPSKHMNHSVWQLMLQKDSNYACQGRVDEVKISVSESDTASKVDYTIFWRGRESMGEEPEFVNKIIFWATICQQNNIWATSCQQNNILCCKTQDLAKLNCSSAKTNIVPILYSF